MATPQHQNERRGKALCRKRAAQQGSLPETSGAARLSAGNERRGKALCRKRESCLGASHRLGPATLGSRPYRVPPPFQTYWRLTGGATCLCAGSARYLIAHKLPEQVRPAVSQRVVGMAARTDQQRRIQVVDDQLVTDPLGLGSFQYASIGAEEEGGARMVGLVGMVAGVGVH